MKYLLLGLLFLVILLVGVLQIPAVQTYMGQKGTEWLSHKSGYKISLDKIKISWLDEVDAEGIHIYDLKDREMVHVTSIHIDYDLIELFKTGKIELDHVTLNEPNFTIGWYEGDKLISFSQFVKDLRGLFIKKKKNTKPKIKPFYIAGGNIVNGRFTYFNKKKEPSKRENYFDYNYFTIDSIYGDVTDFRVYIDSISFNGQSIQGKHTNSHLRVNQIDTKFLYCNKSMLFDDLYASIGGSELKDSITFNYTSTNAFSDFNKKVTIIANLKDSKIQAKDITVFAPSVSIFKDQWNISGNVKGRVNDFWVKNLELGFGKSSQLQGYVSFLGLPEISETLLDLKFKNSKVVPNDIRQYVRSESFHKNAMRKFGITKFSGTFRGFINNFVSHGDFVTELGQVSTDVNFIIDAENQSNTKYSGELVTKGFNLGEFLEVKHLGEVDLKARINPGSKGFTIDDGFVSLNGGISRLVYKNYPYKNIKIDADLSDRKFIGDITINDPNLVLSTKDGILDAKKEDFNIDIGIEKIDFRALGFTKDTATIYGNIDLNIQGLDVTDPQIDDLRGYANFDSSFFRYADKNFNLDGFEFIAQKQDSLRNLSIKSKYLDASLYGSYTFGTIVKDFPELVNEYVLYFENDHERTNEHYENKDTVYENYSVSLDAHLKDIEPLLSVLNSDYEVSSNTQVRAELKRGVSNVFNFYSAPEYFRYRSYEFQNNEIDISSSKLVNSPSSLGSVYIKSDKQTINGVNYFDGTDLLVNINDDAVNFSFKSNQFNSSNYIVLKGGADFFSDSLIVNLNDSYFYLLNKVWAISDDNLITATPRKVLFNGVNFKNTYQLLSLNGALSNDPEDQLKIKLRDFDLENLQAYTSIDIGGLASGNLNISNAFKDLEIDSKIILNDLMVNNDTIGIIKGKWDWVKSKNVYGSDFILIRDGKEVTYVKGSYDVKNEESPLNYTFKLKNTDFNLLEPFMSGFMKDLRGKGNGTVSLTGTVEEPNWDGKITIENGGFLYDYFKTYYKFSNELIFKGESFYANDLHLIDTLWNTKGIINGSISHHWFRDFSADIRLDLDQTFLLNTTQKDNTLYYGSAFGTGEVLINGPFSNLIISSDELTSNEGTNIFIPLEEPDNISKKDYIEFVTQEEKVTLDKTIDNESFSVSGVSMDINFNITEDANFVIIFDANAGDKIRGKGTGLVNLNLDTRGDFNMFGSYSFTKGAYNFTFIDLINKKFDIEEGGKITWDGDPYLGKLDINATYEQYASLGILEPVDENDSTAIANRSSDLDRKVPIVIDLGLTGELLTPNIDFDIEVREYPASLETTVADFESKVKNNDQLKNKQVFSLIVLKQLAPEENFGNIGTGTSQNLSELFSNQFSSWISQFDENLDVDIDLSGFDAESNNIFRVKLAYSLLDGRIRITRDGSFQNVDSSNDLANVFGEWTIEYLITEDGKIRMKAYNRNSTINTLGSTDATTNTTYGFSLTHNKSFDSLRELFKKNPNKVEK